MTDPQTPPASQPTRPAFPYQGAGSPTPPPPGSSGSPGGSTVPPQPPTQPPQPPTQPPTQPPSSMLDERAGQQQQGQQPGDYSRQPPAASGRGGYDEAVYANQSGTEPARGLSIASMVLGVLSLFFGFSVVVPILGFVLGSIALKKEPDGRAFAIAGLWLNGAILLIGLVMLVIIIVALSIGAFSIPFFVDSNAAVINA